MRKMVVILGVLLALVGTACAKQTSSDSGATSTPSSAPSSGGLADGKHYGMLKSVSEDPNAIEFKAQEYFSGEAADKAAREDGVIAEDESMPDDVYVRDIPGPAVTLAVVDAPEVKILKMDGGSPDTGSVSYEEFASQFNGKDPGMLSEHGFWVTIDGGQVTIIEEQFHP